VKASKITIPVVEQLVGKTGMELVATRIGKDNVRVALFDNDRMIASTYSIDTLHSEDNRYQAAQYLVRNVRPQAGPHVAHEVSRMIADKMEKF
jgi:hypothetical protein